MIQNGRRHQQMIIRRYKFYEERMKLSVGGFAIFCFEREREMGTKKRERIALLNGVIIINKKERLVFLLYSVCKKKNY